MKRSAREMLPGIGDDGSSDEGVSAVLAGDIRVAEMPGLAAMHTLLLREHNRVTRHLADRRRRRGINLTEEEDEDEELFQLARRVVVAEWQNIIYDEYLPAIMGRRNMRRHR